MKPLIKACFFVCMLVLLSGCVTTADPYNQPYNAGYTGYTIGMGPSYWGSGYAQNPGYNYGYGNSSLVYYGGTGNYRSGYYGSGYYGSSDGFGWYNNPRGTVRSGLR